MPTQFNDLPYEIQLEFFEYAAFSSFKPRTVEIFSKNGVIYSKTPPPALLHVNQVSRSVVLQIYKPWLPQFKGTSAYKTFAKIAEKKVKGGISAFQNVCVSFEYDLLLIRQQRHLPSVFGVLECSFLRFMAIDVTGWVDIPAFVQSLRNVQNLRKLDLFDDKNWTRGGLDYKVSEAHRYLQREEEKDKKKPKKRIPNFIAPKLGKYYTPPIEDRKLKGICWVSYKYPVKDNWDAESTLSRKRKSDGDEWVMTQTQPSKRARTAIPPTTHKSHCHISDYTSNLELRREVEELGNSSRILNTELSGSRTTRRSTQDSSKGLIRSRKQPRKEVEQRLPTSIPETSETASISTTPNTSTTSTTEIPGPLYVIEKLLSEQMTADGELEILVKWEGYEDEEATWELESELAESAPEMVRLWRSQKGIGDQVFEVERILEKDGDCYIVQWVGFPLARDRTRERCSKLMVDVPLMVQEFEREREGKEGRWESKIGDARLQYMDLVVVESAIRI
jgi:hypothetical protein